MQLHLTVACAITLPLNQACLHSISGWLGVDEEVAAPPWLDSVSTMHPLNYRTAPAGWVRREGDDSGTFVDGRVVLTGKHCDNGTGLTLIWNFGEGLQVRAEGRK